MSHYCELCEAWHSSNSCFNPARGRIDTLERELAESNAACNTALTHLAERTKERDEARAELDEAREMYQRLWDATRKDYQDLILELERGKKRARNLVREINNRDVHMRVCDTNIHFFKRELAETLNPEADDE